MTIGQLSKRLRKSKSLKQGFVANELGVSQTYLSLVEKGIRSPSSRLLKKIATFYGIPEPVMSFMSLSEDQVTEDKRAAFKQIKPAVDALLKEFFNL